MNICEIEKARVSLTTKKEKKKVKRNDEGRVFTNVNHHMS